MAYYQDAPKKRKKVDYAQTGSWDEEGTHYRNHSGRNGSSRDDSDRRASGYRSDRNGDTYRNGRSGDRPSRSYHAKEYAERQSRPNGGYREDRNDRSRDGFRKERSNDRPRVDSQDSGRKYQTRATLGQRSEAKPEGPRGYRELEYRGPARESQLRREDFGPETRNEETDRILCGRNPIREALRSGREIEKLLVQKGELNGTALEIVRDAREKKIMVQEVDKRRLDEIALHHQGLIAFASEYAYADVEDMFAEAESRGEDPFLIILDSVTDPHNLGAVIRTAECVGAHGVIVPVHRSVGLTPAAVKASAGAIEHMKVARVMNLNRTIEELKKRGVWVYALSMDGKDYEKVDFRGATALVIGAEGEGISRLTEEKCDLKVSLPMRGKLDSLNASVAAGVVMYRVLSCRRKG